MNKFLLASISMFAFSGIVLTNNLYAAEADQPAAQQAEVNHNDAKFLGKTGVVLAPGPVRLDKDGKPVQPADNKEEINAKNNPKYLGRTGIILAPGPVRLDKDGKPVQTPVHVDSKTRHKQDLRMKSDLEALAKGKAPITNQQRALARMTAHDRTLLLKRVNEALAAYKG